MAAITAVMVKALRWVDPCRSRLRRQVAKASGWRSVAPCLLFFLVSSAGDDVQPIADHICFLRGFLGFIDQQLEVVVIDFLNEFSNFLEAQLKTAQHLDRHQLQQVPMRIDVRPTVRHRRVHQAPLDVEVDEIGWQRIGQYATSLVTQQLFRVVDQLWGRQPGRACCDPSAEL